MVGNVVGSAFRRRGKRESGENPELTRSGNGVVAKYATGQDRPGRFWGRES